MSIFKPGVQTRNTDVESNKIHKLQPKRCNATVGSDSLPPLQETRGITRKRRRIQYDALQDNLDKSGPLVPVPNVSEEAEDLLQDQNISWTSAVLRSGPPPLPQ